MKFWFFARTTDRDYLYVRISSNSKEVGFNIKEIDKIKIEKVKSSLFTEFHKQQSYSIYTARIDIKGVKYYLIQEDEIILKQSVFFTKDMLKKLPLINPNMSNSNIIKTSYAEWKKII